MRTIIGLIPKRKGTIEVLGMDLDQAGAMRGARSSADGAFSISRARSSPR
jgi:hypothetical protein